MVTGKFMLIDGNSLIYRAFFALKSLSTGQGQPTQAVYGFVNMLFKLLEEENPDYIMVAMDIGRETFRNEEYEEYKANRPSAPEDLVSQIPIIREFLDLMNIPVVEREGYEADDIIGTVSKKAEEEGLSPLIVTGDRDALQLISAETKVLLTKKGITNMELYDEDSVKEHFGLEASDLVEVKGLMGDSSDNIPGVPGVGEKTALRLIKEHKTIDRLLENLDQIKGKRLQENLQDYASQALLSRRLSQIVRDVPIEIDLLECTAQKPDYEKLISLFHDLEFKSLTKRIEQKAGITNEDRENEKQEDSFIAHEFNLKEVTKVFEGEKVAVGYEEDQEKLAICFDTDKVYALSIHSKNREEEKFMQDFFEYVKNPDTDICCYQAKKTYKALLAEGIELERIAFDPEIAAYLLDPGQNRYDIDEVDREYDQDHAFKSKEYSQAQQVNAAFRLQDKMMARLEENDQKPLFSQMEMPLAVVLAEMEIAGVYVDLNQLKEMKKKFQKSSEELACEIHELAGTEFNINSPKQLGNVLFEKLELPVGRKTKTGYSTDVEVLSSLAKKYPIADKVLQYRQIMKLKNTYVEGLTALIDEKTGRIHTSFQQTITTTGRISSTEPNLQNIPIRSEMGREIRKAFSTESKEMAILAADYSQIELRVLAHLSKDDTLLEAFHRGEDIHTRTASEVFHVPMDKVTSSLRNKAKAVNFGIIYGISDYGLSMNLKISREEAKEYIDKYFNRYPKVKQYMNKNIKEARETGFVETIFNRRRYLPEINSRNYNLKSFAERTAMNTPIQGSAADIIKLAMVNVQKRLKDEKLKTKMLLQVHDELIFEVLEEEKEQAATLVKEEMEKAYALDVPMQVDLKMGPNWHDVEKVEAKNGGNRNDGED